MKPKRTDDIRKAPTCKLSKSKVVEKISKNKVIIDFDANNNYFLDEIDTTEYFKGEEYNSMFSQGFQNDNIMFNTSGWHFASPLKTIRKPRVSSGNLSEFSSVIKESRKNKGYEESPFCRLLNESDNLSVDKYQILDGGNEPEEGYDAVYEKVESLCSTLPSNVL